MNFNQYIGFKLENVKSQIESSNINYKIIEVFDTKNTKLGNDIRIINIKYKDEIVEIYVAYF
ncbi:hypothetical protein FDN13_00355 [Caloramator sp. E03]|uniref:hypothetical protein n=1 Tax=Caloramator sp. E03 TaxID=2576307 RepID=UPI001110AB19|nr:hypothetical protein [Caloramator sp. E03]QCX32268.1 hypothetical protein FDN13_00355 [Caloramator sp. E03]